MLTFTDTYTYTPRYQELDFWQEDQLLFDIETTGLSAKYNTIYLIGCAYHKGRKITLLQYLAETPAEESEVLGAFLELCKDFQGLLSFNGIRFDERFILDRCQKLQIPTDALPDQHFDIYKACRGMKSILNLPSYCQKAIESFLGIHREDKYSGGELIAVYQSYCNEPDDEALTLLKLHNYEDVAGMVEILPILSYAHLKDMQIRITDLSLSSYTDYQGIQNQELTFTASTSFRLPAPLRLHTDDYYIILEDDSIKGTISLYHEKMYHFLPDVKSYVYLPEEDMVIPKELASHIAKEKKQKATPATCYIAKVDTYLMVPDALECSDDIYFFARAYKDKKSFIPYKKSYVDETFIARYISCLLN